MATSSTTSDGFIITPEDNESIVTLETAGTYVDSNINFIINGLTASVNDITGSNSKCLVLSKIGS